MARVVCSQSVLAPTAAKLSSAAFPSSHGRTSSRTCLPLAKRRSTSLRVVASVTDQSASDDVTVSFPASKLVIPYPSHQPEVYISREATAADVAAEIAAYIQRLSSESIKARGCFTVALSGGSLVSSLSRLASEPFLSSIDWSKWHVFWADERVVKLTSNDSNFKLAMDSILRHLPIPEDQIYAIDDELGPEEAARDYEEALKILVEDGMLRTTKGAKFPRMDLVLLGVGPDGHVASLFPNSALLREQQRWVLPIKNSPKPPPQRITMTMPMINAAEQVAFVALGPGKSEVVHRILCCHALPGALPAQLVRPYRGKVTWFVDDEAAARMA